MRDEECHIRIQRVQEYQIFLFIYLFFDVYYDFQSLVFLFTELDPHHIFSMS